MVATGVAAVLFPVLMRARHLTPLGKTMANGRKGFATCELERLSRDRVWRDRAIRIVERHVQESHRKQRGKTAECPAPLRHQKPAALN